MKERYWGLDILRIIGMLGIIGLHVLNNGGLRESATNMWQQVAAYLFVGTCYCSVNIFAMLTGYLYVKREHIHSSNLISLITTTAAYCIVISSISFLAVPQLFHDKPTLIVYSLFPPIANRYWYITCYALMFMLIPYINIAIRTLTKKQFQALLGILFLSLSVFTTFGLTDFFKIENGYSPFWLITCYLFGAYVKLYADNFRISRPLCLCIFTVNTVLITAVYLVLDTTRLHQYNSPFIVANALFLFLFLEKTNIGSTLLQKAVLWLSNGAFGVYLIHSHILIFDYILKDAFSNAGALSLGMFCAVMLFSIPAIYLICCIIDQFRTYLFRIIRIDDCIEHLGDKVDKFLHWDE